MSKAKKDPKWRTDLAFGILVLRQASQLKLEAVQKNETRFAAEDIEPGTYITTHDCQLVASCPPNWADDSEKNKKN